MLYAKNYMYLLIIIYSLIVLFYSFIKIKQDSHNAYQESIFLYPIGAFVYVDTLPFALYWIGLSGVSWYLDNQEIFLFGFLIFWCVRALGEVNYWMHVQFHNHNKEDPKKFTILQKIAPGDSVFVFMQVFWQVVLSASLLSLIYQFVR